MYIKIKKEDLSSALKTVIGVVEKRQTLPVLANILTTVKDNILSLTATDAEVEIVCRLPLAPDALNKDNEGGATIPARKFFDICKSLPENTAVQINTEENQALLKAGKSKFKLQTLPAADFPNTPELNNPTKFTIQQQKLKNLLYKTSFCVAVNDVRYHLNGLLLEIGDNMITLVGTDGHRMAVAQHEFESEQEARVIIPRKAVLELSKLLQENDSEITVLFDDNHIRFELSEYLVLTSKLIDGEFPDWLTVLPTNPDKHVIAETAGLKQALSRASILSNEKYKGIRLIIAPKILNINAKNASQEEAEEILEIEYDGEELEIGFNGIYILDALNVVSTKMVQLAFSDENSSCLITEEGNEYCKSLVMPVRI